MLAQANIDLASTFEIFKSYNLSPAFLVPTETALEKSIIDATAPFRSFLKQSDLHDYRLQAQGPEHKKFIRTILVSGDQTIETKSSLYKPNTKSGDPRIWLYGLNQHTSPYDLLAALEFDSSLVVINCSRGDLKKLINSNQIIAQIILKHSSARNHIADELLERCKEIAGKGFVQTLRPGDTGIGYTFESLLGIKPNSSEKPDYKGIEIKTSRSIKNRNTLFSMVPNWETSRLKSTTELANVRGKIGSHGPLKTIFNTVSARTINSHNLLLNLADQEIMQQHHYNNEIQTDVQWLMPDFLKKLQTKHRETFWISAKCQGKNGDADEAFHYNKVTHTGDIDTNSIPILIESGIITVDYLLWEKPFGWQNYINKKGHDFLWKISPKDRHLLFKFNHQYELI